MLSRTLRSRKNYTLSSPSTPVKMLPLSILFTLNLVDSRLVLDSWDELYRDDGSVDVERLVREASPLSVTTEPYQDCPDVDVEVTVYEVILLNDGEEVADSIMSYKIIDIKNLTGTVQNEDHPWISAEVMLRSVKTELNIFIS